MLMEDNVEKVDCFVIGYYLLSVEKGEESTDILLLYPAKAGL
jgi:hypothetical protein